MQGKAGMRRLILALPLVLIAQAPGRAADLRAGFIAAIELNADIRALTAQ